MPPCKDPAAVVGTTNPGAITRPFAQFEEEADQAIRMFVRLGWTPAQWHDLHTDFATHPRGSGQAVAYWLRHPGPAPLRNPLTPSEVRNLHARYLETTAQVLAGISGGATERFCDAFLNTPARNADSESAAVGWSYATQLDLTEPQATGWAATGYLGSLPTRLEGSGEWDTDTLIKEWTARFGPTAYLWVLAGITPAEAAAMQEAGNTPTGQQLRVMVALNGHTLPSGI